MITGWSKANRFFFWVFRRLYIALCGVKPGVYIQNYRHIHIMKNVVIASGVQLIARNHDKGDVTRHGEWHDIVIEEYCWLGANCVILPGVHLGPHTIVGAGSVVTKSFWKQ